MGNVYLRFLTRGMCERAQVRYELSKPLSLSKVGMVTIYLIIIHNTCVSQSIGDVIHAKCIVLFQYTHSVGASVRFSRPWLRRSNVITLADIKAGFPPNRGKRMQVPYLAVSLVELKDKYTVFVQFWWKYFVPSSWQYRCTQSARDNLINNTTINLRQHERLFSMNARYYLCMHPTTHVKVNSFLMNTGE